MNRNLKNVLAASCCLSVLFVSSYAGAKDLLREGMVAFSKGNIEAAQVAFEQAQQSAPDDFRATYWLAQTYKTQGRYSEAKDLYLSTLDIKPDFPPMIYVDLADVSIALDDPKDALRYINKAQSSGIDTPLSHQIKGVALMKLEDHEEALSAFDSVRTSGSSLQQEAAFYSGLTHQEMRNMEAAEQSFQSAISVNRETDISSLAQQQIEMQSALPSYAPHEEWSLVTGIAFQSDSNTVLKPRDKAFAGANGITGDRDQSMVITARGSWRPNIAGPVGFTGTYYFYGDWHAETESQDVASHTVVASPSYKLGRVSYSLPLSYNYTEVNRDAYIREYSIAPTFTLPFGQDYLVQGYASANYQSFATVTVDPKNNRDNANYGLGGDFYHFFDGQDGYWQVGLEAERSYAEGDNWDNNRFRVSGRVQYPLTEKLSGFASASATLRDFDNMHSVFNVHRRDETYSFSVGASYEVIEDIQVTFRNTMQQNNSNAALYEYDRNITNIGVQKAWKF